MLAVTVLGLWLANMKDVEVDDILSFKESLSLLFISGLFILLAARLDLGALQQLGWPALYVFLVLQFIARPLKIIVSTWGSTLTWRERVLLSWIAPRGIVAAAVAALFALRLQQQEMEGAEYLVPLTFMVIIGTVVLQSSTARFLARWLDVAEPEPRGFLIIGANPVARALAQALVEKEFRVLLTDANWENIRTARMEGLPTYYGNPISSHADRHLDLVGIGRMLALSPVTEINVLSTMRYKSEFGPKSIYTLQTVQETATPEKLQAARTHRGYTLFGEDVTFKKLSSLFKQGAKIHSTTLTDTYSFAEYKEQHSSKAIPLFCLDLKNRIHIFVANGKLSPATGWTILSLFPE